MIFRNRRYVNHEKYTTVQNEVTKQDRPVVNFTDQTDEGIKQGRSNTPYIWDPEMRSMTFVDDGALVICKFFIDDMKVSKDLYSKAKVVHPEDVGNE